MLNMIKGCHIHSSQQLKEEYTHNEFTWTANVNAGKIGPLVQDFIAIQASPVFSSWNFRADGPKRKYGENRALRLSIKIFIIWTGCPGKRPAAFSKHMASF